MKMDRRARQQRELLQRWAQLGFEGGPSYSTSPATVGQVKRDYQGSTSMFC